LGAIPAHAHHGQKDAFAQWKRLPDGDETLLIAALAPYKRYLAEHPPVQCGACCRFISQRRIDGFMTEESRSGPPPGLTEEQLRKYELVGVLVEEKDGNDRGDYSHEHKRLSSG